MLRSRNRRYKFDHFARFKRRDPLGMDYQFPAMWDSMDAVSLFVEVAICGVYRCTVDRDRNERKEEEEEEEEGKKKKQMEVIPKYIEEFAKRKDVYTISPEMEYTPFCEWKIGSNLLCFGFCRSFIVDCDATDCLEMVDIVDLVYLYWNEEDGHNSLQWISKMMNEVEAQKKEQFLGNGSSPKESVHFMDSPVYKRGDIVLFLRLCFFPKKENRVRLQIRFLSDSNDIEYEFRVHIEESDEVLDHRVIAKRGYKNEIVLREEMLEKMATLRNAVTFELLFVDKYGFDDGAKAKMEMESTLERDASFVPLIVHSRPRDDSSDSSESDSDKPVESQRMSVAEPLTVAVPGGSVSTDNERDSKRVAISPVHRRPKDNAVEDQPFRNVLDVPSAVRVDEGADDETEYAAKRAVEVPVGSFVWSITNSDLMDGIKHCARNRYIPSPQFTFGPFRWYLTLVPNGNEIDGKRQSAIGLHVASWPEEWYRVRVKLEIWIKEMEDARFWSGDEVKEGMTKKELVFNGSTLRCLIERDSILEQIQSLESLTISTRICIYDLAAKRSPIFKVGDKVKVRYRTDGELKEAVIKEAEDKAEVDKFPGNTMVLSPVVRIEWEDEGWTEVIKVGGTRLQLPDGALAALRKQENVPFLEFMKSKPTVNVVAKRETRFLWEICDIEPLQSAPNCFGFRSGIFSAYSLKWFVVIYPNGKGPDKVGNIEVELHLVSRPGDNVTVSAMYTVHLVQIDQRFQQSVNGALWLKEAVDEQLMSIPTPSIPTTSILEMDQNSKSTKALTGKRGATELESLDDLSALPFAPMPMVPTSSLLDLTALTIAVDIEFPHFYDVKLRSNIGEQFENKEDEYRCRAVAPPLGSESFLWRMKERECYGNKRRDFGFESAVFSMFGHEWNLKICPNDKTLYIALASTPSKEWSRATFLYLRCTLSVLAANQRFVFPVTMKYETGAVSTWKHDIVEQLRNTTICLEMEWIDLYNDTTNLTTRFVETLSMEQGASAESAEEAIMEHLDDDVEQFAKRDGRTLKSWLESEVKLGQYLGMFMEHGIDDLDTLRLIKEEQLEAIGVRLLGHRLKLAHYMRALG